MRNFLCLTSYKQVNKMNSKILVFFFLAIGVSLAVPTQQTVPNVPIPSENVSCVPVENIFDITPDVKRDFFGKIGVNSNTEVRLSLALKNETAKITFDDDVRNAQSSLGININAATFTVFMRTGGTDINLRKGVHTIKDAETFTLDIHVLETGPNFNKYAFVVYLNKQFWFLIEEQPKVEILYSNYITITGVTLNSIVVCPEDNYC